MQRKIRKDMGVDSFVRDVSVDAFSKQTTKTHELILGEILLVQPEPVFSQNAVTIELAKGGKVTDVAYPGAFIDPISGNLHGSYEGPIMGQMVAVGFANGNSAAPIIVEKYPYQGVGNTLTQMSFITPMTKKMYNPMDVLLGHFSGSIIQFHTGGLSGKLPGTLTIDSVTDLELNGLNVKMAGGKDVSIEATLGGMTFSGKTGSKISDVVKLELSSPSTKISGTTDLDLSSPLTTVSGSSELKLNGGIIQIKSATQSMYTLITTLFTILEGLTTTNAVPGSPCAVNPATIALLQAEALKWQALLEV